MSIKSRNSALFVLALFLSVLFISCTQEPHVHTFSEIWSADEYYHWHASTCGHDVVSDKIEHSWDDGVETTAPTHTEDGIKTFTCSVCGATKIEAIPALVNVHTFSEGWSSDETNHWHSSTCGHDVVSGIAEHSWDDGVETTAPTHTEDGVKTFTCSVCGGTKTEAIPALVDAHTFSEEWSADETNHWHASTCGHDVVSDKIEHSWDEGVETTAPTCTENGVKTYTCAVCGSIKEESIPATGHTKVVDFEARKSSLLVNGCDEQSHCDVCGSIISTSVSLPLATPRPGNSRYGFDQFASEPNKQRFYDALYVESERVIDDELDMTDDTDYYAIGVFDLSEFGLTYDDSIAVWKVFLLDNPRYYFLKQEYMVSEGQFFLLIDKEYATHSKRQIYDSSIEQMEQECSELFIEDDLTLTKAVRIHDYVAGKITYAYQEDGVTPETPETSVWTHNVTGVSYLGRGVCEAYAKAFLYLCNLNGVECLIVTGRVKENNEDHAWNYICIEDEWYLVDVTSDDRDDDYGINYYLLGANSSIASEDYINDTIEAESIAYLYDLPELTEERMQLVTVYKNDLFEGYYASPDKAFINMSGEDNDYEMKLVAYRTYESLGRILYEVSFSSKVDKTPEVGTIRISSPDNYSSGGCTYLIDFSFLNPVELQSNLDLSGVVLTINDVDLNGNTLSFSDKVSYVFGFDEDSCIRGTSDSSTILVNSIEDYPEIFVKVDVSRSEGATCMFRNDTNINYLCSQCYVQEEFLGWTNVYIKGFSFRSNGASIKTVKIGNSYAKTPDGIFYGGMLSINCKANVIIGNVYSLDDMRFGLHINFSKTEDYPNVRIDGRLFCDIYVNIQGMVQIIATDESGYPLYNEEGFPIVEVIPADPLNMGIPFFVGNSSIPLNQIEVNFPNFGVSNINRFFEYDDSYGVILSSSVHQVGDYYTDGTTLIKYLGSRTGTLIVPSGYKELNDTLFGWREFDDIVVSNGVEIIGIDAFTCTKMKSIELPESLLEIKDRAFSSCNYLTSVTLPSSIQRIGELLFRYCESLTEIRFAGTIEQWNAVEKPKCWCSDSQYPQVRVVHCTDGDVSI